MMRRYGSYWSRFSQPDPYDGSYSLSNPQSFNRYAYVQGDPVNFIDPSGLMPCAPGDYSAECDSSGFGGWGGGWNFNDRGHPGRDNIGRAEGDYNRQTHSSSRSSESIPNFPLDFTDFNSWLGYVFLPPGGDKPTRGYDQQKLDDCIGKAYSQFLQEQANLSAQDKRRSNLPTKDDLGASAVGAGATGVLRAGILVTSGVRLGAAALSGGLSALGSLAISYAGTVIYKTAQNTAIAVHQGHEVGMRYKNNRSYCVYYFGNSALPNGGAKILGPIGFN